MNLMSLALSVILADLIGAQQMLPALTYGLVNSQYLMPSWRGVVVVTIIIWLAGLLIWLLIKGVLELGARKYKFVQKLKENKRLDGILILGIFLSLGMFLFISEKVPLFATPYPLLAYGIVILAIGVFNTIVGLMIYASLEFYKKWVTKINWELPIKFLGGIALASWLVLLLPVIVKRLGLRARKGEAKNVVLITSDALREDRFTPQYMPETYQWFERGGVVFEKAYSTAPWTVPSFASMMSGKYPAQLGADRGETWVRENLIMLPQTEMVAEKFKDRDYSTMAILTNTWLTEERGFDQGFDYFENIEKPDVYHWGMTVKDSGWFKILEQLGFNKKIRLVYEYFVGSTEERNDFMANAEMVSREAIWRMKELKEPFFVWIHYVDAHKPYEPPVELGPDISQLTEKVREDVINGNLGDEKKAFEKTTIGLYNGEARYHDKEIAKVLRFLDKRGLSKRTAVVFSADHGEELFEDDYCGHGKSLRGEVINVPLGVYPKVEVEGISPQEQEISLHLLGEWLLSLGESRGESWLEKEVERPVFAESISRGEERKAIIKDDWKLVWQIKDDTKSWRREENDEEVLLFYLYPQLAREMETKLVSWREENLEEREKFSKLLERQDVVLEGAAGY